MAEAGSKSNPFRCPSKWLEVYPTMHLKVWWDHQ